MAEPKFPSRASDGSFCVDAIFTGPADVAQVRDWVNSWMSANSVWRRAWSSGTTETLVYSDQFASSPEVLLHHANLCIRLRGAPGSNGVWRDWLVELCGHLTTRFPDLKLAQVIDAPA